VSAMGSGASVGSGASAATGVPTARIPRARVDFTWLLAGVVVLALAAALVLVARSTGLSRAWFPPSHDRRPVTVALLVIAAAGWEFILTLVAVRVVQARQIMRRHRLEQLATTLSATGPEVQGSSRDEPHPPRRAGEA
jgi:uncharacterized integral membrane protein